MLACTALRSCTVPGWYPAPVVTPEESLATALAAASVAFCASLSGPARAALFGRVAANAADTLSSSSSAWLSLTVSALSCARCWTRPVACQLLTSPLIVSAPSTAAVRVGTAITAARRQRTRQFVSANRDRVAAGRRGRAGRGRIAPGAGAGDATAPP